LTQANFETEQGSWINFIFKPFFWPEINLIIIQLLYCNCRLLPSNKEKFVDFIAAQVKSLSFLAYVLRPCLVGVNRCYCNHLLFIYWKL